RRRGPSLTARAPRRSKGSGDRGNLRGRGTPLEDHDAASVRDTPVEVENILVDKPDAAAGYRLADRPVLRGSVDAVESVLAALEQIERTRAERVCHAGLHAAC